MSVVGFNHYNLRASRSTLDELCEFYTSIVGLKVGYRPPFKSFGYWLYAGTQDVLHLTEERLGEERPSHVLNTFDHVAFSCNNATEMERHLVNASINYTCEYVPLTNQFQIFFTDPAGNGVELNFAQMEQYTA